MELKNVKRIDQAIAIEKYLYSKDLIDFRVRVFLYMYMILENRKIFLNPHFFLFLSNYSIYELNKLQILFLKICFNHFFDSFYKTEELSYKHKNRIGTSKLIINSVIC
jgi:hypothetical protein